MVLCEVEGCLGKAEYEPIVLIWISQLTPPIQVPMGRRICRGHCTDEMRSDFMGADVQEPIAHALMEKGFTDLEKYKYEVEFKRLEEAQPKSSSP